MYKYVKKIFLSVLPMLSRGFKQIDPVLQYCDVRSISEPGILWQTKDSGKNKTLEHLIPYSVMYLYTTTPNPSN